MDVRDSSFEGDLGWGGLTMTETYGASRPSTAYTCKFGMKSARPAPSTMAGEGDSNPSSMGEVGQGTSVLAPEHISLERKNDQAYLVPHHFYVYLTDPRSGKRRRIVPSLLTTYNDGSGVIGQVNHYVNTDGTALEEGITPSAEEDLSIVFDLEADKDRFRELVTDGKTEKAVRMWADNLPDWASRRERVWEEDGWSVEIHGLEASGDGCGAEEPSDGGEADQAACQLDSEKQVTSTLGSTKPENKRFDSMLVGPDESDVTYGYTPRPRTTSIVSESDAGTRFPDGTDHSAAFSRTWSGDRTVAMQ